MARFDAAELQIHYAKHRADFAVSTDKEYERLADAFLSRPLYPDLMQCTRTKGDIVRYDVVTQEYGVLSVSGVIRTYFKPIPCASLAVAAPRVNCHGYVDNVQYFSASCLW